MTKPRPKICSKCWSTNIRELPETNKLMCDNCGSIFVKPEITIPEDERCVICKERRRMSKTSQTCSWECAAKLAWQNGAGGSPI
jgi:hypothetical protein